MGMSLQELHWEQNMDSREIAIIPADTKASLQRLCGFYGGSEHELLARVISDLERDTLAMLPSSEHDDYFGAAL